MKIMKNRLHRHNINRPGHKLTNKKCLGMMILIRNKQHVSNIWKHLFRGALRKNCLANMQQIYRRTVMLCNFIEITLRHGYFPFPHIFRTSFPKNTSGRLLLTIKVRFMKKLRNTEAEFKKALFNKEKASSYRKCLYDTRNEISFCHEKKFVYISFHCRRKGILFFFLSFDVLSLLLWNIRMRRCFLSDDFISGIVFAWHLSLETKFHLC